MTKKIFTKINVNNNEDSSEQTDNNKIDSENISENSSNNSSFEIIHNNTNFVWVSLQISMKN